MIYTIVDQMHRLGIESFVWHRTRDFSCTWFRHDTPIVHGSVLDLPADSVLVVPEYLVDPRLDPVPLGRSVVLSQNHFYSFHRRPAWEWATTYPGWSSAEAVWATSHAIQRTIHRISDLPVDHVPYVIDRDLFKPRAKQKTIVVMPRKRRFEAGLIYATLSDQLARRGWSIRIVDQLTEADTALALGEASVFVSLAEREGFGLPALEALASGCAVVGFDGHGGGEYFTDEVGWPVEDGDVEALVDSTAAAVDAVEAGWTMPQNVGRMLDEKYSTHAQMSALEQALARLRTSNRDEVVATATHLGDDFDVVSSMPERAFGDVREMLHAERRRGIELSARLEASADRENQEIQEIQALRTALTEVAGELETARDRVNAMVEEQADRDRTWEGMLNLAHLVPSEPLFPTISKPTSREVELVKSSGLFDEAFFALGTVEPHIGEPLSRFLECIGPTCRAPHPLFDPWFLYRGNARIPLVPLNPLILYLRHGRQWQLSPHPLFDVPYYLAANPDVLRERADPLIHYLAHGASEGRTPSPWFDPVWYMRRAVSNGDAEDGANPLIHYVTEGWKAGLSPSPRFDALAYSEEYPDAVEAGMNPMIHYLVFGRFEGRRVFAVAE